MKLETPVNPNYVATVVRVSRLEPIPGADFIQAMPMLGMQAVVDLNTFVGQVGILFPSEVALSYEYAKANNMFRHAELNADPSAKPGFVEDTRRVKAIRLRKAVSNALFMPLSSLIAAGVAPGVTDQLQVGDVFDTLDGIEICRKYQRHRNRVAGHANRGAHAKKKQRVDERFFPEHPSTAYFLRNADNLPLTGRCVITQKLHGTSIRIGNVLVQREPKGWLEKLAAFFGVTVEEHEWMATFGSRRVIMDEQNPKDGYYGLTDSNQTLYVEEGQKIMDVIPSDYIVYGELIGWHSEEKAFQKNYTYDCAPGVRKLYVYRITHVNRDGVVADLSWDAVEEFCNMTGLNHVPVLGYATVRELLTEVNGEPFLNTYLDKRFYPDYPQAVPLSPEAEVDEGVCIRLEGMVPSIYKAKSSRFLEHESRMEDKGEHDAEAEQEIEGVDEGELVPA